MIVGGTSMPSAFAVLRLMTISILVENSIGRSPGFVPFKILSTNAAARRDPSLWLTRGYIGALTDSVATTRGITNGSFHGMN